MSPAQRAEHRKAFAIRAGKKLRDARNNAGLSQEELAHRAGYNRNYVGNIENAVSSPSLHTMWRMAKGLGIPLSELIRGI